MVNTLCFGDSNTFGTNPRGGHHSWNTRWPKRLQVLLGPKYCVTEEGMGECTIVWDNPLRPRRYDIQALPMIFQNHKPLDLIILFLGINDCKVHFHASPRVITKRMENLCHAVQGFDYGEGYKKPRILMISPIRIGNDMEHCPYVSFDETTSDKLVALTLLYQELTKTEGCFFLDAAPLASPSSVDQLHMDAKNHEALAEGITEAVKGYSEPQG